MKSYAERVALFVLSKYLQSKCSDFSLI